MVGKGCTSDWMTAEPQVNAAIIGWMRQYKEGTLLGSRKESGMELFSQRSVPGSVKREEGVNE